MEYERLAEELKTVTETRMYAEKREAELKKFFRELMGKSEFMNIGERFVATLETRERTSLDMLSLKVALGSKIHQFETKSTYTVFNMRENKMLQVAL